MWLLQSIKASMGVASAMDAVAAAVMADGLATATILAPKQTQHL